jgi:hypothetical protein
VIAKRKQGGEYELYHDSAKLAEVLLKLNERKRQIIEIHYFDTSGRHFLTDYFDATGQLQYAEYDRGHLGNWESISYPNPFAIPVLVPLPIFGY